MNVSIERCDLPGHPDFQIWDRVTARTTRETVAEISSLEKKIAHLEDLRRWRPMSEHPTGEWEAHITRRRGHDSLVGVTKFDFDEDEWAWPRHSEETDWEWTYIPGQEPKEEV